jgi:tetratricopeptide (TPR) repeat protein
MRPDDTLAGHELAAFGPPQPLSPAQAARLAQAQAGARGGHAELVDIVGAAEMLAAANRRHQAADLYRDWIGASTSALRYAACYNLAVALQQLGRPDLAEQAFGQALALNPAFQIAAVRLSALLEERGAIDPALVLWRALARQGAPGSTEQAHGAAQLARYLHP